MTEPVVESFKYCNACYKQIDPAATVCPYCRTYQKWYRNPQRWGSVIFIPLLIMFMWWSNGLFKTKHEYIDHKSDFTITQINNVLDDRGRTRVLTYRIKNNTDYQWHYLNYALISKKGNDVISIKADKEYGWLILPRDESMITVRIKRMSSASAWQLKIKNLDEDL